MEIESAYQKGEGFRSYYIQKIEELQLIVAEKHQNLRRLQAQRNELNAKGSYGGPRCTLPWNVDDIFIFIDIFIAC